MERYAEILVLTVCSVHNSLESIQSFPALLQTWRQGRSGAIRMRGMYKRNKYFEALRAQSSLPSSCPAERACFKPPNVIV